MGSELTSIANGLARIGDESAQRMQRLLSALIAVVRRVDRTSRKLPFAALDGICPNSTAPPQS
jgi:hypothetical protein